MKRIAVNSGELISVGYDTELSDGYVYQFVRVSAKVYAALMSAHNKYEYFKANIIESYLVQKL